MDKIKVGPKTEKEQLEILGWALKRALSALNSMPCSATEFVGISGAVERVKWAVATDIAEHVIRGTDWDGEYFNAEWYGVEDYVEEED